MREILDNDAMSRLRKSIYTKRLERILSSSSDDCFLQMVWAVDALQTGRAEAAKMHLAFPQEAANSDMNSRFAIHKWELETLVNRLLTIPKTELHPGRNRVINCSIFDACATTVNYLRKLEDAESKLYLERFSVLTEMHRIGHRQFHWQRGYFNGPQFYRYAYIYGGNECASYFAKTHGLSMNDFSAIGFGLYTTFQQHSSVRREYSMQFLEIGSATRDAAHRLLSLPLNEARAAATALAQNVNANLPRPLPVAYQPSLLRRFPVIQVGTDGEIFRCPLPQLILQRVTAGVYYDLINGPGSLRNEASDRFENYAHQLLNEMLPDLNCQRSFRYVADGNRIDSPDIIIRSEDCIDIVVECKATKLSIGAQFAEDPLEEAKKAYQEMAKGVFQIWKFFSHARRALIPDAQVNNAANGMVLTLDNWLVMSDELQDSVVSDAAAMADRDPHITADDRRKVVFCSISDLEELLAFSDENSFLRCVRASTEDDYKGWVLPVINKQLSEYQGEKKPYPFSLRDVLPWWAATEKLREQRRNP